MSAIASLLHAHWAIEPSWLPRLAALAQRDHSHPSVREAQPWQKRDYEHVAGPGASKLTGTQRTSLVDGVAILPVSGPIFPYANLMTELSGASSCSVMSTDLGMAVRSNEVGAILLLVDSPGGAVTGIADFARRVSDAARIKPVMAYVPGTCASAAYWIASQASEIAVESTAVIGSIGVVVAHSKQVRPDASGSIEIEIVSANAPNKRPDVMEEAGLAEVRRTLDDLERIFISDVARGRKITSAQVIDKFGKGGVKVGMAAKIAGMVDRVQTFDFTMNGMRKVAKEQLERQRGQNRR